MVHESYLINPFGHTVAPSKQNTLSLRTLRARFRCSCCAPRRRRLVRRPCAVHGLLRPLQQQRRVHGTARIGTSSSHTLHHSSRRDRQHHYQRTVVVLSSGVDGRWRGGLCFRWLEFIELRRRRRCGCRRRRTNSHWGGRFRASLFCYLTATDVTRIRRRRRRCRKRTPCGLGSLLLRLCCPFLIIPPGYF